MIRTANYNDLDKINELGMILSPKFLSTYNLREYLNNKKYIILVNENVDVNAFLLVYDNIDNYEIEVIVVDPNDRGKGIANSLLNYLLNNYNKKDIMLEVAVNNESAINLYKKNNFKVINTRKKYYDGIDAYVMKRVV